MAWSPISEHLKQQRLGRQLDESRVQRTALRKERQRQRDEETRSARRDTSFLNTAEWLAWGALAVAAEAAGNTPMEVVVPTIAAVGAIGFTNIVTDGIIAPPSTYPRQIRMLLRGKAQS